MGVSVDMSAGPDRARGRDFLPLLADVLSVQDLLSVVACGFAATALHSLLLGQVPHAPSGSLLREVLLGALIAALVLRDGSFATKAARSGAALPLRHALGRCGVLLALMLAIALATGSFGSLSRLWMLAWSGGSFATLMGSRLLLLAYVRRLERQGVLRERVAVVGRGELARRLADTLGGAASGVELCGLFAEGPSSGAFAATAGQEPGAGKAPAQTGEVRVAGAGGLAELLQMAQRRRLDRVIVAEKGDELQRLVHQLKVLSSEIAVCPALPDGIAVPARPRDWDLLAQLPLITLAAQPHRRWSGVAKHALDKLLAACAVLLLGPLLLAIALCIRLTSPGPVVFRQLRDGWNGQPFTVFKFRTMRVAEPASALVQTSRNDNRCTAVGRVLRRTSLDELPQLFNVLRGDMSLVGPRPHALTMRTENRLGHEIVAEYAHRHRVRPGITGLAQVRGQRGATDTADQLRARVESDLEYIERWSFGLDLRILALTVLRVFSAEGAF